MQIDSRLIHRFAMNGGTRCGADKDQLVKISTSGVGVTCPACKGQSEQDARDMATNAARFAR